MKKYISLLIGICCTFLISCEKDEIGGVVTQDTYAGEWTVTASLVDAGGNVLYKSNPFILSTANTAANVANEIWIDDAEGMFPLKSKFMMTGDASSFTIGKEEVENLYTGTRYIYNEVLGDFVPFISNYADDFPEAAPAEQIVDGKQEYTQVIFEEGKITPDGATTISGRIADSISLKITLRSSYGKFESRQVREEDWKDPLVPEYEWIYQPSSTVKTTDLDETCLINGHRYTGFAED